MGRKGVNKDKPRAKNRPNNIKKVYKKNAEKYERLLKECKLNPTIIVVNKTPVNENGLKFRCLISKDHKASLGEVKVEEFLIKNHINYRKEVSFYDLPSLRFDFYSPKYKVCIEFDGIQHYKYVNDFDKGNVSALPIRKANDARKNKFCKTNKIQLVRIPYFKISKVESILNKIFKVEFKSTHP